ncbi:MAG: carbonate dehydratase [Proteobacteria bacterium]|uniref:carbonate dehydratase n=1 Tax=Rudaea sp. TaxID=2136325 RepID=UPI001D909A21|nr:carbonate dehydratase [Pseudomonadota bacterium]MBS0568930.1 carbonate dehydratase [Pseudomonadota bacterium]
MTTLPPSKSRLAHLLERNHAWSLDLRRRDPDYFHRLADQQAPKYLWIGCSDSRVPANQIIDMAPGEVFVQRNVANVVVHTDLNCLSTIQFAVDVLKVEHILVVGHYGCGGVRAVLDGLRLGLVDNWLRHVGDVAQKHASALDGIDAHTLRHARLCELNVIEQVVNAAQTTVVRDAWERGQNLTVHGWCYSLENGLVNDLGIEIAQHSQLADQYHGALARRQEHLLRGV